MTGNDSGFTIVELMVVLILAALVTAAIYKTFPAQQKAVISQEQVTAMQQEIRAAMNILEREIAMAGYNPRRSSACGAWMLTAKVNEIKFALDVTGGECDGIDNDGDGKVDKDDEPDEKALADGKCDGNDETLSFFLAGSDYTACTDCVKDANCKTDPNCGADPVCNKALVRQTSRQESPSAPYPCVKSEKCISIAENVQKCGLGFAYAFDADDNGQLDKDATGAGVIWAIDTNGDGLLDLNLDTNHDGEVDEKDNAAGQVLSPTIPIGKIRAVKIWLLVRTDQPDSSFTNKTTYAVANQRITVNDGYRRRLLRSTVYCLNMGL